MIFFTSDLTYAGSIGLSYVDLGFHEDRLYLLQKDGSTKTKLLALDADFDILETITIAGTPLRLFVHEDELTVFTRDSTDQIGVYSEQI